MSSLARNATLFEMLLHDLSTGHCSNRALLTITWPNHFVIVDAVIRCVADHLSGVIHHAR